MTLLSKSLIFIVLIIGHVNALLLEAQGFMAACAKHGILLCQHKVNQDYFISYCHRCAVARDPKKGICHVMLNNFKVFSKVVLLIPTC